MEKSRSFESLQELGETISKELGDRSEGDTLCRWMSFRIAELMIAIEAGGESPKTERLKSECSDLIVRLWSMRESWPVRKPLSELSELLEGLFRRLRSPHTPQQDPPITASDLMSVLDDLNIEDALLLFDADVLDRSIDKELEYLEQHRDELCEDEVRWLELIRDRKMEVKSPAHPNAAILKAPKSKRKKLIAEHLTQRCAERVELIDAWSNASQRKKQTRTHKPRKTKR